MFAFSVASEQRLATVQPALAALARAALACSAVDFAVVQGGRTLDQQQRLYGKGRSAAQCTAAGVPAAYAQPSLRKVTWTLHSNHIGGHAIDVCPVVGGVLNWDDSGALGLWPQLASAFRAAAAQLGTPVFWGGDFAPPKRDRPHFSLVPG